VSGLDSVDAVLDLFHRFGHHRYGEAVSQLDHALQCAALARGRGLTDEIVAAALLHDVGHLLELRDGSTYEAGRTADRRHEVVGAEALAGLFPVEVTGPVRLHVSAKRWRCTVDRSYRVGLSPASVASLVLQGGPLDPRERAAFETDPRFEEALALREVDDAGKVEGLVIPGLADYEPLLRRLAAAGH
jgi:predicted HD phosphohydrolase